MMLLSLFLEAGVVGIICIIFLILFIVAGVRQMMREEE
jgi:O-antigen ligase